MTDPVSRTSGGSGATPTDADFQNALGGAMTAGGGSGQGRSRGANGGGGAGSNGGGAAGGMAFSDPYLESAYRTYIEGGTSPLSADTQRLVSTALDYDREANPNPEESKRLWDAARGAIAGEARGMMQLDGVDQDAGQPDFARMNPKLLGLNMWTLGNDRRALETGRALEDAGSQLYKDLRQEGLTETIGKVDELLKEVNKANGDENFIRRGWDNLTGGGAREDFTTFLEGKLSQLRALDEKDQRISDEQYLTEMKSIMGDFNVKLEKHLEDVEDMQDDCGVGVVSKEIPLAVARSMSSYAVISAPGRSNYAATIRRTIVDLLEALPPSERQAAVDKLMSYDYKNKEFMHKQIKDMAQSDAFGFNLKA